MRRTLTGIAALTLGATLLAGCGGNGGSGGNTDEPAGTGAGGQTISITFKGDSVTPNGDRVKVQLGKPVVLKITADKAGEIHVHSTPEQEISYPAGSSTEKVTIDKPGVVDVESHALDKTIVQLQVS
ncbi:MAG: hypothetical protein ACTHOK_12435 [Nocardioidaceae bacterium]